MPSSDLQIPRPTAHRLSLYLREIQLMIASGEVTVSSRALGEALGYSSAQVRKDLAWVVHVGGTSEGGQAGVGYDCASLLAAIRSVIGTDRPWSTLLIGAGNIGRALLGYGGFASQGFRIFAVLDGDERVVGKKIGSFIVQPMSVLRKCVRTNRVTIAMLAVPRTAAQEVASQLCAAGVRGILNFAPVRLAVTEGVSVTNVDVSVALEQLAMNISRGDHPPLAKIGAA